MRIGIIGLGKMGEAIVVGLQRSDDFKKHFTFQASTRSKESAQESERKLGIPVSTDNRRLVTQSEILILCVKPHQAESVLKEVSKKVQADKLLISICASITIEQLQKWSGGKVPVIRAMPNTPCLVGEGMTAICPGPGVNSEQLVLSERIFQLLGRTSIVEASLMDGVTGLSACGPAYVYLIIEALSEAGVKLGLPRKTATLMAAQTLMGASKMTLERGEHPAALKDEVTTPAGCTIDGLMVLEEGKLRSTLIKAVLAAAKRSRLLGKR